VQQLKHTMKVAKNSKTVAATVSQMAFEKFADVPDCKAVRSELLLTALRTIVKIAKSIAIATSETMNASKATNDEKR
jgi:hypothetical protein